MTGNLDKEKKHQFPKNWAEDEDNVIVFQQRLIEVSGNLEPVSHPQPIQVYAKKTFDTLNFLHEDSGRTGFEDMRLKVTVLHDSSIEETEEDIDLPKLPAAETAETTAMEIMRKAAEMAESGVTETEAQVFTERSQEKAESEAENITSAPAKETVVTKQAEVKVKGTVQETKKK